MMQQEYVDLLPAMIIAPELTGMTKRWRCDETRAAKQDCQTTTWMDIIIMADANQANTGDILIKGNNWTYWLRGGIDPASNSPRVVSREPNENEETLSTYRWETCQRELICVYRHVGPSSVV